MTEAERRAVIREVADFLEDRASGTYIGSLLSASWAIREDLLHEDTSESRRRMERD